MKTSFKNIYNIINTRFPWVGGVNLKTNPGTSVDST